MKTGSTFPLINLVTVGVGTLLITHGVNQAAQAAIVKNPDNGHFYEYIPGSFSWTEARTAAESRTFNDQQGYLATVTSAAENEFIVSNFEVSNWAGWIGANDVETEGVWKWMTGPEAGTTFLQNGVPLGYTNFSPGQPSNAFSGEPGSNVRGDEDYAHIWFPSHVSVPFGTWNDLPNDGTDWAWKHPIEANNVGYYVEYSISSKTSVPEPTTAISSMIAIAAGIFLKKQLA